MQRRLPVTGRVCRCEEAGRLVESLGSEVGRLWKRGWEGNIRAFVTESGSFSFMELPAQTSPQTEDLLLHLINFIFAPWIHTVNYFP